MTLLSRVEALTGPDRGIDAELARMIGEKPFGCPTYTASVDAALAFAEKVLPGIRKRKTVYEAARHKPFCVWFDDADDAYHFTEPLAIILAVFRAKEGM